MANLIQIKRSTTNNAPEAGSIRPGELAYSLLNTSNSLFVGDSSNNAIRVGGGNYLWLHQSNTSAPGTHTANAVVITNGNSFVSGWKTNSLTVGADGATVAVSNISTTANSTQLGGSAGGSNTELVTSYAIKTYVDGAASASIPVVTSTQIGFGNTSNRLVSSAEFTFDDASDKVTIGNTTVNTAISPTAIVTTATLAAGNTTITGFITSTSTVNATALNIGANVNVTTTGFNVGNSTVNVSSNSSFLRVDTTTVNGSLIGIPGQFRGYSANLATVVEVGANVIIDTAAVRVGNTTVNTVILSTGIDTDGTLAVLGTSTLSNTLSVGGLATLNTANITSTLNVVGNTTVNGAFTVNNTVAAGNTTITGNASVTSHLSAGSLSAGDTSISGNLTITGTLTTVNANNLTVTDSMIQLASNNTATDILDIGFFASYEAGDAGAYEHTGLFRDASDSGVYKLFQNLEPSPDTTVDTANNTFEFATLQSFLKTGGAGASGLIANSTTIALTANSTLSVAIVANTLTLSTALIGTSGGTGLATVTAEDILVANATNGYRKLSVGSNGTVLQVSSGVVAYNTLDGGTF